VMAECSAFEDGGMGIGGHITRGHEQEEQLRVESVVPTQMDEVWESHGFCDFFPLGHSNCPG